MSNRTFGLDERIYQYLLDHSPSEPEILARLREETARDPKHNMQIAPEQGHFMALLARLIGARRYLEIGVYTGYSALAVARALPEDGEVVALDNSPEWTDVARRYWAEAGVDHKTHLYLDEADRSLDTLVATEGRSGTFDYAFIDADKENYPVYWEYCLELVRPGGLIAVDNVLRYGRVADPEWDGDPTTEAIRRFNDKARADERVDFAMLPVADGLTLAVKR
ncbi:SAM-dependent methyltransferase [Thiohalorhabdus denitrificans]|uniref:Predicted O-methyltransferase YrrM n=1 Tax=Thiohalorhabdus denitrificans TaxID=381306 RepID=A0A0N8PMM8_9GAMM|nr:class I SAM-dependent methyltransferase [Thiohalorhabdus denitrificans]KPV39165.1 SAM-dependent methyltransferase [Thiohalorhabdus denitrificans]SCX75929.1 Predicted O-methyltransferase YrrM [Thiohalorhabdus denitrificans]